MRDVKSLHEIMTENDDWMNQLDAAEGLVKLGDRRGYEFLLKSTQSNDEELVEVAKEILDGPDVSRMRYEIEAEQKRRHEDRIQAARKRLQSGGKVFRYKMVYIPARELIAEGSLDEGFEVSALEEHGFEGWEIVHMLPSRRNISPGRLDDDFTGAYFLLKRRCCLGKHTSWIDDKRLCKGCLHQDVTYHQNPSQGYIPITVTNCASLLYGKRNL